MTFTAGQRVRFKGDPEKQVYFVDFVNADGSVDLETPRGEDWEYVPVRLLEKAPDPPREGEVWEHRVTGSRFFITLVKGDELYYALAGTSGDLIKAGVRVFAPDKYVRVFPTEES